MVVFRCEIRALEDCLFLPWLYPNFFQYNDLSLQLLSFLYLPILYVYRLGLTVFVFIFRQPILHLLFFIRLRVTTLKGLIIQRSLYYYYIPIFPSYLVVIPFRFSSILLCLS